LYGPFRFFVCGRPHIMVDTYRQAQAQNHAVRTATMQSPRSAVSATALLASAVGPGHRGRASLDPARPRPTPPNSGKAPTMLRTTLAAVAVSLPLALLAAPAASARPDDLLPHPTDPAQRQPATHASGRQGSWIGSEWGTYPHTGTNVYGGYQNPHHKVVQTKPCR
jgi:hypothetical protein